MTAQRGPADASNYRVKVGRFGTRWYIDPLPGDDIADASDWHGPSVSATKPPFANKYVPMKTIAQMSDDEWGRLAKLTATDRYEAVKVADKRAGRINMDRGTLVHEWAESLVAGRPIIDQAIGVDAEVLEQARRFRPALESFFNTYQPEPVAVECVCLHRTLNGVGYGGTADLFARVDGGVWAIDWKSRNSDHGAYLEEAAQGGAYIGAEYMIVDDDGSPARTHIPDVDGVLIVSITEDSFEAYPIDADGAIEAYRAMHAWWVAQRQVVDNKVIGRPWAPRKAEPPMDDLPTVAPVETPAGPADRDNLRARISGLIDTGHTERLRYAWPEGVPTLSSDGHSTAQLEQILAAVRKVETDVGAQFHDDDMQADDPQPMVETVVADVQPPDEGGECDPGDLAALKRAFEALTSEQLNAIKTITAEAREAGRSISVQMSPTVRRWSIARALIRWAHDGGNVEELWAHAVAIATEAQTVDADQTLGALVASFTIEQADELADRYSRTAAA